MPPSKGRSSLVIFLGAFALTKGSQFPIELTSLLYKEGIGSSSCERSKEMYGGGLLPTPLSRL
jgi:hypothetical protein